MRKLRDIRCNGCGEIRKDQYVDIDLLSPHDCAGRWEVVHLDDGMASAVHGDDIPGGLVIKNGLCNDDGTPRTWYTKSAIREEAKRRGLTWGVTRHIGERGSDRNKHSQKWV